MSEHQVLIEISVGGIVSCIDGEGGRPLAFDEFDALVDKIAAHLHSALGVSDPCVWGQASTGDLEVSCVLAVTASASADNPLDRFIRDVCDAGELVSVDMIAASEEPPIDPGSASPVRWSQKKRHYDLVPA